MELIDTVDYSNQLSPGRLGFEFALEIKRTLARVLHYPGSLEKSIEILNIQSFH